MKSKDTYVAAALALTAILAWTGVTFFVRGISDAEAARIAELQSAQQSSTQQSALVRMHAIALDTAQDRGELDKLLTTDVGTAATIMRNVGRAARVDVKLSGALPELAPPASPSGPQIQAVGFALQADGTFADLMHTVKLLEALPLASKLERFDIQRTQDAGGAGKNVWRMSVYIRVLTTSDIAS